MSIRPLPPPAAPQLNVVPGCRTTQTPRGDQLAISTAAADGRTVVVALHGHLDLRTVQQARDVLVGHAAARVRRIVVDLSRLQFMDVPGARALLEAQGELIGQGGSMALACPQRPVGRVLELTGTDQYIPVYRTITGAVRGRVPLPRRAP